MANLTSMKFDDLTTARIYSYRILQPNEDKQVSKTLVKAREIRSRPINSVKIDLQEKLRCVGYGYTNILLAINLEITKNKGLLQDLFKGWATLYTSL